MADRPPYPETDDDIGVGSDPGSPTVTSRWLYAFWIIGILTVLAFVILHLTGTIGPGVHS